MSTKAQIVAAAAFTLLAGAAHGQIDEEAAKALAKQNKCTKCHSSDKKKDGPSFKETAAKYKAKPDGAEKLFTHLTSNPKVEVDGKEETHEGPKTTNQAEIRNLVAWILSH